MTHLIGSLSTPYTPHPLQQFHYGNLAAHQLSQPDMILAQGWKKTYNVWAIISTGINSTYYRLQQGRVLNQNLS